jgi:hypothetical protein
MSQQLVEFFFSVLQYATSFLTQNLLTLLLARMSLSQFLKRASTSVPSLRQWLLTYGLRGTFRSFANILSEFIFHFSKRNFTKPKNAIMCGKGSNIHISLHIVTCISEYRRGLD